MPITLPKIDDRRYEDLVAEALARIPVHTPEWTNFNRSDPGVTLIEVFSFLTESLLYRANQIPERNRKKFLKLLGIRLQSATAASGLITINQAPNAAGSPQVVPSGVEVRAGDVPFRTSRAVDVLPVEGRFFVKRALKVSEKTKKNYQALYASYREDQPAVDPQLYEAVPFPLRCGSAMALSDTVDNKIWLALLVREADARSTGPTDMPALRTKIAKDIANRTLSVGVVPSISATRATLSPGRRFGATGGATGLTFRFDTPKVSTDPNDMSRDYGATLEARTEEDVFSVPGVIEVSLPDEKGLRLWQNIEPLEAGVDDLPPILEDPSVDARCITWVRIMASATTDVSFLWMGINAVPVTQRARFVNELVGPGTGEPDQVYRLAKTPVLPNSVQLSITPTVGRRYAWKEIDVDDLSAADAEVPVPDPRIPPGGVQPTRAATLTTSSTAAETSDGGTPIGSTAAVFAVDAESGELRFGDGAHGMRPPEGAVIRATYDSSSGSKGNVGAGAVTSGPTGFVVTNPVATWGGADAESVAAGEKQIARYLQHRDRLVTAEDFRTITLRAPGLDIARVEVLPNYDERSGWDAAGIVTLMVIPTSDPEQPDAPLPRKPFIDALCRYLDARRLITTEVHIRPPEYQGIWISIGIEVSAGYNSSEVCENVKDAITKFLAPTAGERQTLPDGSTESTRQNGWKLGKAIIDREIAAVATRTAGVEYVEQNLLLAKSDGTPFTRLDLGGLQLPRILGIRVTDGAPASLDELMGKSGTTSTGEPGTGAPQAPKVVQVPAIPEECR